MRQLSVMVSSCAIFKITDEEFHSTWISAFLFLNHAFTAKKISNEEKKPNIQRKSAQKLRKIVNFVKRVSPEKILENIDGMIVISTQKLVSFVAQQF